MGPGAAGALSLAGFCRAVDTFLTLAPRTHARIPDEAARRGAQHTGFLACIDAIVVMGFIVFEQHAKNAFRARSPRRFLPARSAARRNRSHGRELFLPLHPRRLPRRKAGMWSPRLCAIGRSTRNALPFSCSTRRKSGHSVLCCRCCNNVGPHARRSEWLARRGTLVRSELGIQRAGFL